MEYLATGHPLVQAFHAEHLAVAGQVICSPEAWNLVSKHFEASEVKGGAQIVTKCLDPIRKVSVYTTVTKSEYIFFIFLNFYTVLLKIRLLKPLETMFLVLSFLF